MNAIKSFMAFYLIIIASACNPSGQKNNESTTHGLSIRIKCFSTETLMIDTNHKYI
jgi:hypothetical protein